MPELPEVETVRVQLHTKLIGKTLSEVEVFHDKTVAYDVTIAERLSGKTIADIDRIGKLLIISFQNEPDLFLLAHLKMTGQFFYVDTDGIIGGGHRVAERDWRELPNSHTRVAFHFTDNTTLYFNDMRLFGYTKLATRSEVDMARGQFGPEPIASEFDCEWFVSAVRKRKRSIKAVLLDQTFVAGLGNIYVDEALWRAQVRPDRRADRLTKKEAAHICTASVDVLREAIAVGGTTFQHFVDTEGARGNFTEHLKVFARHGTPCPRCGTLIEKIRVAGRGTHYCPTCQS